jgi:glycosyltransferase involved in cell wall biosynthesis
VRFHVVALPHTVTDASYSHCAYTQKVRNFCRMMTSLGHTVFHYGAEGSEAEAEHITVLSAGEQRGFFGEPQPDKLYPIQFDEGLPYWKLMNARAAEEIQRRVERRDFLCLIGGRCQREVAQIVGEADAITVEYGVGYFGTFARFRVFESYTHQAAVYGTQSASPDGFAYDAVIPNAYDPEEFPLYTGKRDNYLLYLARLHSRKGILAAVQIAKAADLPLVIAGQGAAHQIGNLLVTEEGCAIELSDKVFYVGAVGPKRRWELLSQARALLQPTVFLEPFGGNVVEAALCFTPAITSDCGAFAETVKHGITGYRCHTLEQYTWAAEAVTKLDPVTIRDTAEANYSIQRVRCMYQEYFSMLAGLWGEGWPERRSREQLDWLNKA